MEIIAHQHLPFHHYCQDPAFSDSIRHVMDGSLPNSLKHIIRLISISMKVIAPLNICTSSYDIIAMPSTMGLPCSSSPQMLSLPMCSRSIFYFLHLKLFRELVLFICSSGALAAVEPSGQGPDGRGAAGAAGEGRTCHQGGAGQPSQCLLCPLPEHSRP